MSLIINEHGFVCERVWERFHMSFERIFGGRFGIVLKEFREGFGRGVEKGIWGYLEKCSRNKFIKEFGNVLEEDFKKELK